MYNLIKIFILNVTCYALIFTNTMQGSSLEGEEKRFISESITSESIIQERKEKALSNVHAIIRSRYQYNKKLFTFLKDKNKTIDEKINHLNDVSPCQIPENITDSIEIKKSIINTVNIVTKGTKRDLYLYSHASQVLFLTNPQDSKYVDTTIDELYIYFLIFDVKERDLDTKPQDDTKNHFYEHDFITTILDILKPCVSVQASLFGSCLFLADNGDIEHDYTKLESFKLFDKNRKKHSLTQNPATSLLEDLMTANLKAHPNPVDFMLATLDEIWNPRHIQRTAEEEKAIKEYQATSLFDGNINHENDVLTKKKEDPLWGAVFLATIGYRKLASPLAKLNNFYVRENEPHTIGITEETVAENITHTKDITDETIPEKLDGSSQKKKKKKKKAKAIIQNTPIDIKSIETTDNSDDQALTDSPAPSNEKANDIPTPSPLADAISISKTLQPSPLEFSAEAITSSPTTENANTSDGKSYTYDPKIYKTDKTSKKSPIQEVHETQTITDDSWKEELLTGGTSLSDFNKLISNIKKALNGKMITKKNSFIFLFNSPHTNKIEAITGHVPHGAQLEKKWSAWRKSFLTTLKDHKLL